MIVVAPRPQSAPTPPPPLHPAPQVHYLGDPSRGSVWEEVIINCPRHIKLLAMSATVKNPDDLGGWIGQVGAELRADGSKVVSLLSRLGFCFVLCTMCMT